MITQTATDNPGLVLTPEVAPGLVVQRSPYEGEPVGGFGGEVPAGGLTITPKAAGLNASASESPAQGMSP